MEVRPFRQGIRIGSVKDGKVTAFIPEPSAEAGAGLQQRQAKSHCLLRHAGRDACAVERAADELNGPGIDSKPFGYLAHAISASRSRPMVG
jgi:hypothetical protein